MVPFFFSKSGPVNAEVRAWVARVTAAGSSVSTASSAAHDNFVTALKTAGVLTSIARLNTYGANTLSGALCPLINTIGNAAETNHNFVSGDFSVASGLTGDGSTKYLDTGALVPSYASLSSSHLCVVNLNPASALTSAVDLSGGSGSTSELSLYASFAGKAYFDCFDQTNGRVSHTVPNTGGVTIGSRTAANVSTLYRNGSSLITGSTTASSIAPSASTLVFCYGNTSFPSSNTQGAYSLGGGLTPTQVGDYQTALSTLMTALGRTIPA